MALTRTVTPAGEPVSTDDMKAHLRVEHNDDDAYIDALVAAAREDLEAKGGLAFIDQTWELRLDTFPAGGVIYLPRWPVSAINSVTYLDSAGDSQTWAAASYRVDTSSKPARLTPAYGVSWPSTRGVTNAVTISFDAGYGPEATDVPNAVVQAIKLRVGLWYEHREEASEARLSPIPMAVRALLSSLRLQDARVSV